MTVEYLDLTDSLAIATAVTALDIDTLLRVNRLGLAESALDAKAGVGETEFYPDFVDKAAVLAVRLGTRGTFTRIIGVNVPRVACPSGCRLRSEAGCRSSGHETAPRRLG